MTPDRPGQSKKSESPLKEDCFPRHLSHRIYTVRSFVRPLTRRRLEPEDAISLHQGIDLFSLGGLVDILNHPGLRKGDRVTSTYVPMYSPNGPSRDYEDRMLVKGRGCACSLIAFDRRWILVTTLSLTTLCPHLVLLWPFFGICPSLSFAPSSWTLLFRRRGCNDLTIVPSSFEMQISTRALLDHLPLFPPPPVVNGYVPIYLLAPRQPAMTYPRMRACHGLINRMFSAPRR